MNRSFRNCKLRIANCKLQIQKACARFAPGVWFRTNLQFAICNLQFAIPLAILLLMLPAEAVAQERGFRLFPERASNFAGPVDNIYFFSTAVALFFTLLIFVLIVWFVIKYRRGAAVDRTFHRKPPVLLIEITWMAIPLALTMVMFAWGAKVFVEMHQPPEGAQEIRVLGKQWMWKTQHEDETDWWINELHVPAGEPVRLQMISDDVIHSFYIPAFRTKMDVLPGRYTTQWFTATTPGEYRLYCAEYCGTGHSEMIGRVVVHEPEEFSRRLAAKSKRPPRESGEKLFADLQCNSCHDPSRARGPSLAGLYGKTVPLEGGRTVVADDHYIRESIRDSALKVVAGYRPVMPAYTKQQVSEEEVFLLVAYLKSLSDGGTRTE